MLQALREAVNDSDVKGVQRLLSQHGMHIAREPDDLGDTVLHLAAAWSDYRMMKVLLEAAPDLAMAKGNHDFLPLHRLAASCLQPHAKVVQLLLEAAPGSAAAVDCRGRTPLHYAAAYWHQESLMLLLGAAPEAAFVVDESGKVPLQEALVGAADWHGPGSWPPCNSALDDHIYPAKVKKALAAAACLLTVGSVQQQLSVLNRAGTKAQPLFATLAARQPMTAAEWQLVPAGCARLSDALPVVLARSKQEAGRLVQRLPLLHRQRLHTFALCLNRAQQELGISLLASSVQHILSICLVFDKYTESLAGHA